MNRGDILRVALMLLFWPAFVGCGVTGLRHRHDDNPRVRALQNAGISQYGDRPIAGESIGGFFRNKVGLIAIKGGPLPVGRAVPISSDGYYLTAWHVVDNGDFRLSNSVSAAKPLQVDEYPGRVVWHDTLADLALVKFEYRPAVTFRPAGLPLRKGVTVFSGATGLNSGTLFTPRNDSGVYVLSELVKNAFGNGSFQTAGKVAGLRVLDQGSLRIVYESTLVGRGGMSGAPVVNSKGHLVGIVTSGQTKLFSGPTTSFSMLEPRTLEAIIQADRRRR